MHPAISRTDDPAAIQDREQHDHERDVQGAEYRRIHEPGLDSRCGKSEHYDCYEHYVEKRERQHELPAERHQLIVAEAWQRPTDPHEEKKEEQHLREHYSDGEKREPPAVRPDVVASGERDIPPAEEERSHQRARGDHPSVLRDEEERELHRAV